MKDNTSKQSYFDEYIGHYVEKQSHFTNHPWTFRRSGRDILSKIKEASDKTLGDFANIGLDFASNADPVFVQFTTESFIRRNKLEQDILIPCLGGANVRNWTVDWHGNRKGDNTYAIIFHDENGNRLDNPNDYPNALKFLSYYKDLLKSRRVHSQNVIKAGIKWYELAQSTFQMHTPKIIFPCKAATHGHFFYDSKGEYIANQSCQVAYLKKETGEEIYILVSILNSSITNYFIKQRSTKMSGQTISKARFEWLKKDLAELPIIIPEGILQADIIKVVSEMLSLADRAMELSMYNLVRKEEYNSVPELLERRQVYIDEYRSVQARMKDIQNEIDHLVYKIYGITAPEDIAELEQPLYKRPWKEPDWDKEFDFEARDYVNDLIEEIFAKQQFPNELPMNVQDIGSELAANPKAEVLRGAYYHGGPQPMAVFAKECMDADCRAIPFDEEAVKVGRGKVKVDIFHERFFRFDELDKELYGWTGWSAEGQLNVFLRLAQRATSEGKSSEPFKKWVESRVLRDIADERTREQTRAYLERL